MINQLDKLERYLKTNGYLYTRNDITSNTKMVRHQIIVYHPNGRIAWDAICHPGSYGYECGLLEVMGDIVIGNEDSVNGYLTADDIVERLENGTGS